MKSQTYKKRKQRKQTRRKQSGGFLLQTDGFTYFTERLRLPLDSSHRTIYTHPNFSRVLHDYVITNSNVTLLTDSSLYGYVYTAELKPDAPIYFSKLEFDGRNKDSMFLLQPVRKFIIKVVMIGFGEHKIDEAGKREKKLTITEEQLNDECDIQNFIYNRSATTGVSLTPALMHKTPLYIPRKKHQMILDSITNTSDKRQLSDIISEPYAAIKSVGYVFMEYAEGFEPMYKYIQTKVSKKEIMHAAMLVNVYLIELALLGYEHGDIHYGNFMYNPNAFNTLYDDTHGWIHGSLYILDFGRAEYSVSNKQITNLRKAINDINSDKITKATYHSLNDVLKLSIDYNVLCEYIRKFYKAIEKRKTYMPVHKNTFFNLANVVATRPVPVLEPAGGAGAIAPEEAARRAAAEAETVRRAAEAEAAAEAARRAAEAEAAAEAARRAAEALALRPILKHLTHGMHYDVYSHENVLVSTNAIFTRNDAEKLYFLVNDNEFDMPIAAFNTTYFFTFANAINNIDEFVLGGYYNVYQYPEDRVPVFIAKYRFIHTSPTHLVFFIPNSGDRVYIPIGGINTTHIFVRSTA